MKAILIDDEPLARSVIKEYLQAFPQIQIVQECNDGFEGIKAIMQLHPDLIFLDIQMPKINGFEMLELVDHPPQVIFTTAYEEFAIRAFESHAADYLLKPFTRERFEKAIHKLLSASPTTAPSTEKILELAAVSPAQSHRVVVKENGKIRIIPTEQIHFLEAADDYVKIHTEKEVFLKNRTMSYFESILNADIFVRTHRSFIVNINQVTRIDPFEKESFLAVLKTGKQIPVSKNGYSKLRGLLGL